MKRFTLPLALAAALLGTAPAFAGGLGFDLPRLDFPAPQPQTTRDCASTANIASTCGQHKS